MMALPGPLCGQGIGTWNAYMAYHDIQQIREAGTSLFVLASNGLYQYNLNDGSITTYDKVGGLSDVYITHIAWNSRVARLIAVYGNSNIDLVGTDGRVTNISDLYSKTMTADKTVNAIRIDAQYAYLATNFGVVKVDMARAEISETYNLGIAVARVALDGGLIYARTPAGEVWAASRTANLVDKNNWSRAASWRPGIFDEDLSDYDKYHDMVATLRPGGPDYNSMGFLMFKNGRLYTANGTTNIEAKACIQVLADGEWTVFENDIEDRLGHRFIKVFACDVDPADPSRVLAGAQTGLYEFRDGRFVKEYNIDNSPLKAAATVDPTDKDYVEVTSVRFDSDSHLWLTNSISPSTSLFELTPGGEWISHHDSKLMLSGSDRSLEGMEGLMFDSRGLMWFGNNFYRQPALLCYNKARSELSAYDRDFANQDGTGLTLTYIREVAEDRDGNIWFASNAGPLYVTPQQIASGDANLAFNQFKVPRNDGTNYADYLLGNVDVSAVAIDGANRKWFGTSSNGVYLISADNMTQLQHFTAENSPLLSNNVMDIAIDGRTGEVFFGTDRGLCSYMSDATDPAEEMEKDNVYAYPNPVEPGYTGLITVTGLSFDADVKVVTANGALVASGRSNGGTFTWDGRDTRGRRVASGVYSVVTAKSDGSKGTVCKIAIVN